MRSIKNQMIDPNVLPSYTLYNARDMPKVIQLYLNQLFFRKFFRIDL